MENLNQYKLDGLNASQLNVSAAVGEPSYTKGEELLNVITHALGAVFGVFIILFGIFKGLEGLSFLGAIIFGLGMIVTYSVSSVYHGLKPSKAKRVLRVIDHCTVYLLIIGTYSGIILTAIAPYSPLTAIIMLSIQWGLGTLAICLTAIDMKKYQAFSFVCYIALGWCIIFVPHIVIGAMTIEGFAWLLSGGIGYTLGSILYGMGRKNRYMHGVFHIFCLVGSALQFVAFAGFCL